MKQGLAMVTVLAMMAPAVARADEPTESQNTWRYVFAASVMVTAVGATMAYWGEERIDNMEHALCTGNYVTKCGHAPPTTQAQVDDFNEKGQRGQSIGRAGFVILGLGATASIVSGIMGFKHRDHEVVVTPTVTPTGAGAALTLRF